MFELIERNTPFMNGFSEYWKKRFWFLTTLQNCLF